MANDFDRIFKEEYMPRFAQKLLGIDYSKTIEVKDKIQITPTLEREADDLRIVLNGHELLDYGLQLEVHVADEDLRARCFLHHGMFFHKYLMQLRQILIYVGEKPNPTEIIKNRLELYGESVVVFEVFIFQKIPVADFLDSDQPGELILAILADFGKRKPVEIIREILKKLLNLTAGQTH